MLRKQRQHPALKSPRRTPRENGRIANPDVERAAKKVLVQIERASGDTTRLSVGAGLVMAFGVTRLMTGFLPNVAPADPLTFVATAMTLCAVGLLATWIPARRATTVDPAITLRCP